MHFSATLNTYQIYLETTSRSQWRSHVQIKMCAGRNAFQINPIKRTLPLIDSTIHAESC